MKKGGLYFLKADNMQCAMDQFIFQSVFQFTLDWPQQIARPVIIVITKEAPSWMRVPVAMKELRISDAMSMCADDPPARKKYDKHFHFIFPSGYKIT